MAMPDEKKPVPLDYRPPSPPTVPRYRKVLSGTLVLAGLAAAVFGAFLPSEPARVNVWTAAGGFIVWGLVIRFQHVRL
jgi:hypothetical protein